MKEALEKLIRRVILKKYPWVKDSNVLRIKNPEGSHKEHIYGVTYYIDYKLMVDLNIKDGDADAAFKELKSETKNLYDVLGPSPSDGFVGCSLKIYKGNLI